MRLWMLMVAFFVAVGGFFVARVPFSSELAAISSVSIVLFAIPALVTLRSWLGDGRAIAAFIVLGLYAIAIEATSVVTGFPYTQFTYSNELGDKLGGLVPWTVPFAWVPIMVGAYSILSLAAPKVRNSPWLVALLAGTATVVVDLVLDPGATALSFWIWENPGPYYGVPVLNFAGWLLSGIIGGLMLWQLGRLPTKENATEAIGGLVLIIIFWTSVSLWLSFWVPAALGIVCIVFLSRIFIRQYHARRALAA